MADRRGVEISVQCVGRRMADPENVLLASSILGTSDPTDIACAVDAFVQSNTGRHVRDSILKVRTESAQAVNRQAGVVWSRLAFEQLG
jgi:hypothetical protein